MSDVTVMTASEFSKNFPEKHTPHIERTNVLETIDEVFKGVVDVIIVSGPDVIGKTTLLADYARRHSNNSISLFIKPLGRAAYSFEVLKEELCDQLHWLLNNELFDGDHYDDSFLYSAYARLHKKARHAGTAYYFIIDGLQDIPNEDKSAIKTILVDLLPFGNPMFNIIVSGNVEDISPYLHKNAKHKDVLIPRLTFDETKKLLNNIGLNDIELEEIHKLCDGKPGLISLVSQMLEEGKTIQQIINAEPKDLDDFLAIDWSVVNQLDSKYKITIALISYSITPLSFTELSELTGINIQKIKALPDKISFLSKTAEGAHLKFKSDAFQRYAAKELLDFKEDATNLLIDYLLKGDQSLEKSISLPEYFHQAGRGEDLVEYLTPDRMASLLDHSEALAPLHRYAEMGFHTAKALGRRDGIFQYSLNKSIITDYANSEIWQDEIKARIAAYSGPI